MIQDRLVQDLCARLQSVWIVDPSRCVATAQGFDCWPGDQKVSVAVTRSDDPIDPNGLRLSLSIEFLEGIDWSGEEALDVVRHLGLMAPCYSVQFLSDPVADRLGDRDGMVGLDDFLGMMRRAGMCTTS